MKRRGFLTAGTWCLDRNMTIDNWPEEDTVGKVSDLRLSGGGNGCNFACDIRLLDPSVPVETQAIVGDDQEGEFLLGVARDHGIGHVGMKQIAGARTMVTDAYQSTSSGRRTHIFTPGTADLLSPDHFDPSASEARFFHLGLPGVHPIMDAPWKDAPSGWVSVLQDAKTAGLETNLELVTIDPARLRDIVLPCLPHLTYLVINDFEIGALANVETGTGDDTDIDAVNHAATQIAQKGAMKAVVVHFTRGALAVSKGDSVFVPSVNLPDSAIVGANGAGDAFAAGFFLGLHRERSLEDSLRLGHAAAATSMTALGTYTGMKPAEVCLASAEQYGWRNS